MNTILESLFVIAAILFAYHHFIYPKLLKIIAKRYKHTNNETSVVEPAFITVIMPCFNEQRYIADKLFNFAYVDYPKDKFKVIIANDGSTDNTQSIYEQTIQHPLLSGINFEMINFKKNRGKIALLNELMSRQKKGLVCLSDVSALISVDAFKRINSSMQDPSLGVVAAKYSILNPGSEGEEAYWQYQVAIKQHESDMGSTIGVHGALYCMRAELYQPLTAACINDDFIIPMQVIAQGYKVLYDDKIIGVELEQSDQNLDYSRRIRIATGNVQQVIFLKKLLHPRFGTVAFNFFSGKFLRVLMPWCMILMFTSSALLSFQTPFWLGVFLAQVAGYLMALLVQRLPKISWPKPIRLLHYLVSGHAAAAVGWCKMLRGQPHALVWRKIATEPVTSNYLPVSTRLCKRLFDVFFATLILLFTFPLWLLIAAAIKLESSGPVFFLQFRIGLSDAKHTRLFYMIKFRTMVQDAEKLTGAVWAGKNDCRITKVGKFLRLTRLDELPQMFNVLRGDMSLVGPRPERPEICARIEPQIPFFSERTCFVRPGITGLAQVNQGYDSCMDDVRSKVMYDHSYALALHSISGWLLMDLRVLLRTVLIMVLGRGQ